MKAPFAKESVFCAIIGAVATTVPAFAQTEMGARSTTPDGTSRELETTTTSPVTGVTAEAVPSVASDSQSSPVTIAKTPTLVVPSPRTDVEPEKNVAGDASREAETSADAAAEAETLPTERDDDASPVRVYGFADFSYLRAFVDKTSPWLLLLNRNASFYVGNFNLYLDAQLSTKWRSLGEVRFTYAPAGTEETNLATGVQTRNRGAYGDYVDFGRPRGVGGIFIERLQLEYRAHDYLTVTLGQWLSPYGIWVVDHGSPVIIGVYRPFFIGAQLIPERQVGLLATGLFPINDDFDVSYALGLSNGRTDFTSFEDMDGNKAVTARAALTYHGFGETSLGVTYYRGRYTEGTESLYGDNGATKSRFNTTLQFDEHALATDLRWTKGPFHAQTEWIVREVAYTDAGRPISSSGGFTPNTREWGGYGLVGYRLPWLSIMPYAKLERSPDPSARAMGLAYKLMFFTGGINIRPVANVVFKLEYSYGKFIDKDVRSFSKSGLQGLVAQVAWAF